MHNMYPNFWAEKSGKNSVLYINNYGSLKIIKI